MGTIVAAPTAGAAAGYQRPADWLTLPTLTAGEQRIVGLHAVYNAGSNFCAFTVRGACTIDWGDGSAPEDVADNVVAEHNFVYADLGAGTLSTRGYRQAIVSITMQGAETLTSADFTPTHTQAGLQNYSTQWLDVAIVGSSVTVAKFGYSTRENRMMEKFDYTGAHSITSMNNMFERCYSLRSLPSSLVTIGVTSTLYMFRFCYSLQTVPSEWDVSGVQNMQGMFWDCYSLQTVPSEWDVSGVQNMSYMFYHCYSLQSVTSGWDTSAVTSMGSMFSYCYSLQSVPSGWDTGAVTNMRNMFYNCYSLQSVPSGWDTSAATNMGVMFYNCYSLQTAPLAGTVVDISYASCKLGRVEMVAIFTALGSAAKTITITNNWGVADLTAADRLIATNKGWTIAA